jgi:LPXTG-motif cell wall-anchored protein
MSKTNRGVFYALTTAFFWGFLAIALKVTVGVVYPLTIVWFRFLFAFTMLFVWFLITDRRQLRILVRPPWQIIVAAIALSINYIGFLMGIKYTSPSNAQVIIQLGQVLLALSGIILFKEKVDKFKITGFIVVIIGFVLFYSQQLLSMVQNTDDLNKGVLLTVIAAFAWTTYAIMQKKLLDKYQPQTLNLFLYALPVLLYFPFAKVGGLAHLPLKWWGMLCFLGMNTLIAYGCMTAALKYLEANKVSSIVINNPIITFITMAILTAFDVPWIEGEHFNILTWIGAFMLLGGAFIVVKKWKQKPALHSIAHKE